MKNLLRIFQNNLGEYLERLLLVLFGVGLGVKILVVNHNIDPRALNLNMMVADYILIIFAPLAAVALNMLINRLMPDDEAGLDLKQARLNEILEISAAEGYTNIDDLKDENGIIKSSDLLKANFPPEDVEDAADQALEHLPG